MTTAEYFAHAATPEHFSSATWKTPSQIADDFLMWPGLTTHLVQVARTLTLAETQRRKTLPDVFVKCPRCYGYHGERANIDSLCEKCEVLTAPARYDARFKKD